MSGRLGHSTAPGKWMLVAVMALMLVAIAPVGALSDRIGRKPLLLTTAIGYIVLSVPAIMLLGVESLMLQVMGLCTGLPAGDPGFICILDAAGAVPDGGPVHGFRARL